MFGQLSNRESLRDLVVALEAHQPKYYHLGLGKNPIAKTTFATAYQNRDNRFFEEFTFYMMDQARNKRAKNIFKLNESKWIDYLYIQKVGSETNVSSTTCDDSPTPKYNPRGMRMNHTKKGIYISKGKKVIIK